MSGAGTGLFYLFAVVALVSALGTITLHSPIRAAMSLLAHIVSLSGLFLLLHAHLLAALQILVYAGAVVVLFVFVIMMIGPAADEPPVQRGMLVKTGSIAVMFLVTALLASPLLSVSAPLLTVSSCTAAEGAECEQFGGVTAFSKALFGASFVPFELISVLLTVAIIGAIAVARGRTVAESQALQVKLQHRDEQQAKLAEQTHPVAAHPETVAARESVVPAGAPAHGGQ